MENKGKKMMQRRTRLWFGGILIVCGVLCLLFNFNVTWQEWRPVIFSWQILPVIIGIFSIFQRSYFFGIFNVFFGTFFLIPVLANSFPMNFDWVEADFLHKYWALLIIVAGVLIVLNIFFGNHYHSKSKFKRNEEWYLRYYNQTMLSLKVDESMIDRNLVFSARDEIFLEPEFRGGHISCIFGGFSLDLRKTVLPEGKTVLVIESVFSGVEIDIPENWNIELCTVNIFGGSIDSRSKRHEKDLTRKLIITGKCIFGGIEIR